MCSLNDIIIIPENGGFPDINFIAKQIDNIDSIAQKANLLERENDNIKEKLKSMQILSSELRQMYETERKSKEIAEKNLLQIQDKARELEEKNTKYLNDQINQDVINKQEIASLNYKIDELTKTITFAEDKFIEQTRELHRNGLLVGKIKRKFINNIKEMSNDYDITWIDEKLSPKVKLVQQHATVTRSTCTSAFIKKVNVGVSVPYDNISIDDILHEVIVELPEVLSPIPELNLPPTPPPPPERQSCEIGTQYDMVTKCNIATQYDIKSQCDNGTQCEYQKSKLVDAETITNLANIRKKINYIRKEPKTINYDEILSNIKTEKIQDVPNISANSLINPQLISLWTLLGQTIFSVIGNNQIYETNFNIASINEQVLEIAKKIEEEENRTKDVILVGCKRSFDTTTETNVAEFSKRPNIIEEDDRKEMSPDFLGFEMNEIDTNYSKRSTKRKSISIRTSSRITRSSRRLKSFASSTSDLNSLNESELNFSNDLNESELNSTNNLVDDSFNARESISNSENFEGSLISNSPSTEQLNDFDDIPHGDDKIIQPVNIEPISNNLRHIDPSDTIKETINHTIIRPILISPSSFNTKCPDDDPMSSDESINLYIDEELNSPKKFTDSSQNESAFRFTRSLAQIKSTINSPNQLKVKDVSQLHGDSNNLVLNTIQNQECQIPVTDSNTCKSVLLSPMIAEDSSVGSTSKSRAELNINKTLKTYSRVQHSKKKVITSTSSNFFLPTPISPIYSSPSTKSIDLKDKLLSPSSTSKCLNFAQFEEKLPINEISPDKSSSSSSTTAQMTCKQRLYQLQMGSSDSSNTNENLIKINKKSHDLKKSNQSGKSSLIKKLRNLRVNTLNNSKVITIQKEEKLEENFDFDIDKILKSFCLPNFIDPIDELISAESLIELDVPMLDDTINEDSPSEPPNEFCNPNFEPILIPLDRDNIPKSLLHKMIADDNYKTRNRIANQKMPPPNNPKESYNIRRFNDILTNYLKNMTPTPDSLNRVTESLIEKIGNTNLLIRTIIDYIQSMKNLLPTTVYLSSTMILPDYHIKLINLIKTFNDIEDQVISEIENRIFTFKSNLQLCELNNLTYLYIGIIENNRRNSSKLRKFIYKCLYYHRFNSISMISIILPSYHYYIIPHKDDTTYDSNDPIILALLTILLNLKSTNSSDKLSKDTIKYIDIISQFLVYKLKYRFGEFTYENLIEKLINQLKENSLVNIAYSLIIIAKRQGFKWSKKNIIEQHIKPYLQELLQKVSTTNEFDKRIAVCLQIISSIAKTSDNANIIIEYLNIFHKVLNLTNKQLIQETAIESILKLSRFSCNDVFDRIVQWNPNYNVNRKTILILKTFLYKRPYYYWKKKLVNV